MDRRFESRLDEMLGQAEVSPELLRGLPPRVTFLEPFLQSLAGPEQKQRAVEYVTASDVQAGAQDGRGNRL